MKTEEFISTVRRVMLKERLDRYRERLKNSVRNPEKGYAPWQKMFICWDSLNDQQRDAVWRFVRMAMVETISELFSLLDNVSTLNDYRDRFQLIYGPNQEKVSGDLLDYFLAAEEDDPAKEGWEP